MSDEVIDRLAAPFDEKELKFRPGATSGARALALVYVDARVIQDRLDEVLGPANWQDLYSVLDDGSVVCTLKLRLDGEWIEKMDVGSQSEQPDGGDRMKAAFSDALKRAAVKFGIGRYLYRVPPIWADYDPKTKRFAKTPRLPGGKPAPAEKQETARPTRKEPPPPAQVKEEPDARIGDEGAQKLVDFCVKQGWRAFGPHGFLAWLGLNDFARIDQLTVAQAKSVCEAAREHFGKRNGTPQQATAKNNAPRTIDDEQLANLSQLMIAKGKTPQAVWRFLRVNVDGDGDLRDLTVPQYESVSSALAKMPDVAAVKGGA